MASRLRFVSTPTTQGILPVIDDTELPKLVGAGGVGLAGLTEEEARIVARMLQGWVPGPNPTEVDVLPQSRPKLGYPLRYKRYEPEPQVVLPGGDKPHVSASDVEALLEARDGVPVAGCECGGGVGCSSLDVVVIYRGDTVSWTVLGDEFVFPRTRYDNAIRELLELAGEAPRLIDE